MPFRAEDCWIHLRTQRCRITSSPPMLNEMLTIKSGMCFDADVDDVEFFVLGWKEDILREAWTLSAGLCSERYTHRDRNIPQDPRFQHLGTAAGVAIATKPARSPTLSPQPSPPRSPFQCPSPEPSTSPDPSPPPTPSQCPSPEPSPPPSPSQVLSPEPSPPASPPKCPCPQPGPPSPRPNELNPLNRDQSGATKKQLDPTVTRDVTGNLYQPTTTNTGCAATHRFIFPHTQ